MVVVVVVVVVRKFNADWRDVDVSSPPVIDMTITDTTICYWRKVG